MHAIQGKKYAKRVDDFPYLFTRQEAREWIDAQYTLAETPEGCSVACGLHGEIFLSIHSHTHLPRHGGGADVGITLMPDDVDRLLSLNNSPERTKPFRLTAEQEHRDTEIRGVGDARRGVERNGYAVGSGGIA
jgi:hypothetical protein